VIAEKKLDGKNDCERRNKHQGKCQRHQPYIAAPSKNCTAAVRAAFAEKPATQREETEQQHHDVCNPYRHGLTERKDVIKNDHDEHDNGEKETGSPRHAVAKTCGKLQKPRAGDETHCCENEPRHDHKQSGHLTTKFSRGFAAV
jgi:hypothetical protein